MENYKHNDLVFSYLDIGPTDGPVVVLLHGFPANAESWLPVAEKLANKNYRVIIPEQRGYTEQARPRKRRDYRLDILVGDLYALSVHLGCKKIHLVGHDWGGIVAWAFADKHTDLLLSLIVMSTPHPRAFLRSLPQSRQLYKARHVLFFQLPWLPEWVLSKKGGDELKQALMRTGLKPKLAAQYAKQMQDRGRLRGALHWYRALPLNLSSKSIHTITVPTLYIYGNQDSYVSQHAAQFTKKYLNNNSRLEQLANETHWMPEQSPDLLADMILGFIEDKAL